MLGRNSAVELSLWLALLFWVTRITLLRALGADPTWEHARSGYRGLAGCQVSAFCILSIFFLLTFLKYNIHAVGVLGFCCCCCLVSCLINCNSFILCNQNVGVCVSLCLRLHASFLWSTSVCLVTTALPLTSLVVGVLSVSLVCSGDWSQDMRSDGKCLPTVPSSLTPLWEFQGSVVHLPFHFLLGCGIQSYL